LKQQKVYVAEQLALYEKVIDYIDRGKRDLTQGSIYDPWCATEQQGKLIAHERIANVLLAAADGVAEECNLTTIHA